jgi:tRNA(Ile)-lysidine synthase TilS/MesJ
MFEGQFDIIRPLIYVTNKELIRYTQLIGYKPLPYDCVYADTNKREVVKGFIKQFYKLSPDATDKVFQSMQNINRKHLP